MQKKFLIIFLFVILITFTFSVSCFASSNRSIYDNNTGLYHLNINFKDELEMDIPNMNVYYEYSNPDIYFLIAESSDSYKIYTSSSPFYYGSTQYGNHYFYSVDNSTVSLSIYNKYTGVWEKSTDSVKSGQITASTTRFFLTSHDISNQNGTEVVFAKHNFLSKFGRTITKIELKNTVTREILSILPVVLTVLIGFIAIRKGISFTRKKLRNA